MYEVIEFIVFLFLAGILIGITGMFAISIWHTIVANMEYKIRKQIEREEDTDKTFKQEH